MPGLAGVMSTARGRGDLKEVAGSMGSAMVRSAWHKSGQESFDDSGVAVAWVHSIADGLGAVPLYDSKREVALILVGELASEVDSSLLNDYAEQGHRILKRLNGRFGGVLVDFRRQSASVFTDRYGLGRIYVHEKGDCLLFASEAKSILRQVPETREFDEQGLAEWLGCGCPLQGRTLFRGIRLLPPGAVWTMRDGEIDKDRYFDSDEWESLPRLSPEDYFGESKRIFAEVAPRYFQGKGKIGLSLTGGLDSRMVAASIGGGAENVTSYCFSGPYKECEDVKVARKVAAVCGFPFQTIDIEPNFFEQFPDLAARSVFVSDGCMDVSGSVEIYANRKARSLSPVRVTGNYGSEILRCHRAFRPGLFRHPILTSKVAKQVADSQQTYENECVGRMLSFIAFKQVPWFHCARLSLENSELSVRSPFLDNDLVRLTYQAPVDFETSPESAWRVIRAGNAALAEIPNDRGVADGGSALFRRLRQEKMEFLAKVEYAYDYGMPDWLARLDRLASPLHLERLILGQQKFCHFRVWYRDQLGGFVRETLLEEDSLPWDIFDRKAVKAAVEGHLSGRCNATLEIHCLLSVALIKRKLLVAST